MSLESILFKMEDLNDYVMTKTLTAIIAVFFCIIFFPIVIGICGGLFGLMMGLFGVVFGIIGVVFGALFGVIGYLTKFGIIALIALTAVVLIVVSKDKK